MKKSVTCLPAVVYEQINIAAVCLDGLGRIVWANARLEALMDANDGLRRTLNNTLAAASRQTTASLQRLLEQAGRGLGGMRRLERPSGQPSWIAIAVPRPPTPRCSSLTLPGTGRVRTKAGRSKDCAHSMV